MTNIQSKARNRRKPQQARSRDTVDAILTATTRLLIKDGYAKLSTNRIAVVAGVSVGSLYQYFSSKEELVEELLERRTQALVGELRRRVALLDGAPVEEVLRELVRLVLEARSAERELYRALSPRVPSADVGSRVAGLVELVRVCLETRRERIRPENLDLAAFLVVSSLEAAVDSALLDRPELLEGDHLVEELTALICRYVVRETSHDSSVRLRAVGG